MQRTLIRFILCALLASAPLQAAKQILLQFSPEADAPVIAKIIATDKVILDAAPARQNTEKGWRQLPLPTPFEGYVPVASLNKSMAILGGTPVHYLPTADSAEITTTEEGDRYEVIRVKEEWATVRFHKDITGYFLATEAGLSLNAQDIVVSTSNTQARESTPELKPAKAPRLLTGKLVREIATKEPYPVRLKSPEGRLIAYVDFSGLFIPDLSPYISQKVYLRGEVHPLKGDSSKLVIYAQDIRIAE